MCQMVHKFPKIACKQRGFERFLRKPQMKRYQL